jgi:hypothetical protein
LDRHVQTADDPGTRKQRAAPNSSRKAISSGISVSAIAIS